MKKNIRSPLVIIALGLLSSPALLAQGIAENAVIKAGEVIDAVLEAYGGADAIANLNTVYMEVESDNAAVGQSRKPGPPFDRNITNGYSALDFENSIFANRFHGMGGGNEFDFGTVINGENSYNISYRAEFVTPLAEPDFNTTSGPFIRVTAPLLVKQLQDRRQTSHWLGVEDVDGRPHDVITLVMEVGPGLSLYFDQETRILNKSERILPPFGVVEYRFRNHQEVNGIPFNRDFELLLNGVNNITRTNSGIRVNEGIVASTSMPEGYRVDDPIAPDTLSMTELDEGVYLVGANGAYSLFVEMQDYVFAAGGTSGAATRIAELRKAVPDKPIRYALLSHHHNDHIPGSPDYVAEGATLLTVAANETAVRAVAGDAAKLEFVDGKKVLSDGQRRVEIYNIGPTPHAENFLIAYLPEEGILFEADHFGIPRNGTPVVPGNNALAFAEAVKDLDFKRVAGEHSPAVGTRDDLRQMVSSAR